MPQSDKSRVLGHLFAIITIIIWGTTFIASKLLLKALTPTQLMMMRFALAYVFLRAIKPIHPKLIIKDELLFLLLGITGCSVYFLCENMALLYTQTTNVSILVATAPILTSILTHFFTKEERIGKNTIIGFIVAFTGIVLVVFNGTVMLRLSPAGDLLSIGAAVFWAIYSVLQHTRVKTYDAIVFSDKVMFYGFITAIPILLIRGEVHPDFSSLISPVNIICLLFLGILGSGAGYVFWRIAGKNIGIVTTNNYIYFIPFVTMLSSALVLKDERITLMGFIGSVLVVAGVAVSQKKAKAVTDNLAEGTYESLSGN